MSNYTLDDFERDLLQMAAGFENGKEMKKHLRKEAGKLGRKQKNHIKTSVKKYAEATEEEPEKQSGALLDGVKKGKPYKYDGDWSIRAYNKAPHAHLIDQGHIIRARGKGYKNGDTRGTRKGKTQELGFVPGVHFMDKAQKEFEEIYYKNTQKFIDDILKKGLG